MARILIVDDDPVVRQLLRMNFELEGHEVIEAIDGRSGLDAARISDAQTVPDAVVLDVMMPAPDGFAVCTELRTDPATAELPIVLLTALALGADRQRGLDAGADAFVTKPFDPLELVEVVEALIRDRADPAHDPTPGEPSP